jgi:cytochrome c oxidase assembly protein subunit 15
MLPILFAILLSNANGRVLLRHRVSPYRLATHLTMAFGTFSLLLWTALGELSRVNSISSAATATAAAVTSSAEVAAGSAATSALKSIARVAPVVVFLTACSGAFVAGNDAGNAYNTFPAMTYAEGSAEESVIPPLSVLLELKPSYRNLFENTATVQLNHRVLAGLSVVAVSGLVGAAVLVSSRGRTGAGKKVVLELSTATRRAIAASGLAVAGQVTLGVVTLLSYVPIHLAAMHQAGSVVLLTCTITAAHFIRRTAIISKFRPPIL